MTVNNFIRLGLLYFKFYNFCQKSFLRNTDRRTSTKVNTKQKQVYQVTSSVELLKFSDTTYVSCNSLLICILNRSSSNVSLLLKFDWRVIWYHFPSKFFHLICLLMCQPDHIKSEYHITRCKTTTYYVSTHKPFIDVRNHSETKSTGR